MHMIKKLLAPCIILVISFSLCSTAVFASAQKDAPSDEEVLPDRATEKIPTFPNDEYYNGIVIKILDSTDKDYVASSEIIQKVRVRIKSGAAKGIEIAAENNIPSNAKEGMELNVNDKVIVVATYGVEGRSYYVTDLYRLPSLAMLGAVFVFFIILFGRLRGFTSLLGLLFSIGVIAIFIVPQILSGKDPLVISILGSLMIAFVSLYLAHGFNKRTTISLLSTLITLGIAAVCSVVFVHFGKLFGLGTEDALFLQINQSSDAINLRGLLLGGIIIGVMGILDDVTTAQTAAVEEINKANPQLSFTQLYIRGISVGKEHISSLVNTLALAYAGVSLPLFLLFIINKGQPLWVIANGENIAEEIIRTLVGSVTLILAVPIATYLAAYFFSRRQEKQKEIKI